MKINNKNFTIFEQCDASRPWGLYFQDSASPQMEALVELHDNIMFYLVIILFAVGWIITSIIVKFIYSNSPISHKYVSHGTLVELIWTITPSLILMFIVTNVSAINSMISIELPLSYNLGTIYIMWVCFISNVMFYNFYNNLGIAHLSFKKYFITYLNSLYLVLNFFRKNPIKAIFSIFSLILLTVILNDIYIYNYGYCAEFNLLHNIHRCSLLYPISKWIVISFIAIFYYFSKDKQYKLIFSNLLSYIKLEEFFIYILLSSIFLYFDLGNIIFENIILIIPTIVCNFSTILVEIASLHTITANIIKYVSIILNLNSSGFKAYNIKPNLLTNINTVSSNTLAVKNISLGWENIFRIKPLDFSTNVAKVTVSSISTNLVICKPSIFSKYFNSDIYLLEFKGKSYYLFWDAELELGTKIYMYLSKLFRTVNSDTLHSSKYLINPSNQLITTNVPLLKSATNVPLLEAKPSNAELSFENVNPIYAEMLAAKSNSLDIMENKILTDKNSSPQDIQDWIRNRNYMDLANPFMRNRNNDVVVYSARFSHNNFMQDMEGIINDEPLHQPMAEDALNNNYVDNVAGLDIQNARDGELTTEETVSFDWNDQNKVRDVIQWFNPGNPDPVKFPEPYQIGMAQGIIPYVYVLDSFDYKVAWCIKEEGLRIIGQYGSVIYVGETQLIPTNVVVSDPQGQIARGWSNTESNQPAARNLGMVLLSLRYNGHITINVRMFNHDELLRLFIETAYNSNLRRISDFRRNRGGRAIVRLDISRRHHDISNGFIDVLLRAR